MLVDLSGAIWFADFSGLALVVGSALLLLWADWRLERRPIERRVRLARQTPLSTARGRRASAPRRPAA